MAVKTNFTNTKNEYYRITLDVGIDENGKRVRKQFYGKSKKDAENKRLDYLKSMSIGIDNNKRYFAETFKNWLFEVVKMSGIKPTTFARYEGLYRNYILTSPMACTELNKVEPLTMQRYYNDLLKANISESQVKYINKFIKMFFNFCIDSNYIVKNPCTKTNINSLNATRRYIKEIETFSHEEINKMAIAVDSKIKYISLIAVATGMRRGEILALNEGDISYKTNEITINKSIATTAIFDADNNKTKQTILQDPKTTKSERVIPLPASIIQIIKKAILLRNKEKLKAGSSYNNEYFKFLFLSEQGNLINAGNIDKTWAKFLKDLDIKHKKFHALRHTYATMQFENDIPVKTVSNLLGHTDINITLNTYTHVLKKQKEKAIDILDIITPVTP